MREPVKLQFSPDGADFAPKKQPLEKTQASSTPKPETLRSSVDLATKAVAAEEASRAEGFTSRSGKKTPKVDGRTLRRTGRNQQLNIGVTPETKDRFLSLVHEGGFKAGGEFLDFLLNQYESLKASKT